MRIWHETDGLVTDRNGRLWVTTDDDVLGPRAVNLGPIEQALDAVPLRYLGEYEEHLDLWRDAARWDERADVDATYRSQQGFR